MTEPQEEQIDNRQQQQQQQQNNILKATSPELPKPTPVSDSYCDKYGL